MGVFYERIGVGNPAGGEVVYVSALVDTGASYTVLPASLSSGLGIEGYESVAFTLADGRRVAYDIGDAQLIIGNLERVCIVVLGPEGNYLLGAETLADFRLLVNPYRERLEPER